MNWIKKFKNRPLKEIFKRGAIRAYRCKLVRGALAPFVRLPQGKTWIFIIGCYNSGTTLLNQILASHPEISGLPDEGIWLTDRLPKPKDFGWPRMWWKCKEQIILNGKDEQVDVGKLKKDWAFWYDRKKDFFLEKSIPNGARTKWLQNKFKPSYFIWIVRNGYAVAEGIRRRVEEEGLLYPISWCAQQWVESNRVIEKDSAMIQNITRIKYEDFSTRPGETIRDILSFLPIKKKKFSIADKKWNIHQKTSLIKNMNFASIKRLSKDDFKEINKIASASLKKYGYSILH